MQNVLKNVSDKIYRFNWNTHFMKWIFALWVIVFEISEVGNEKLYCETWQAGQLT